MNSKNLLFSNSDHIPSLFLKPEACIATATGAEKAMIQEIILYSSTHGMLPQE